MRRIIMLLAALVGAGAAATSATSMSVDGGVQVASPPYNCQYLTLQQCATAFARYYMIQSVWWCEPIAPGYCRP